MSNIYDVQSAMLTNGSVGIVGTVDTNPSTGPVAVSINVPFSALAAVFVNGGGAAAVEAYIAPLMLGVAIANGLKETATVVTQLPTGSFTL